MTTTKPEMVKAAMPAATVDPRAEKVHEVVMNKMMSRREKLEAITAMGLTPALANGELVVTDDSKSIVYTTAQNPVNFEGSSRSTRKAK